MKQFLQVGIVVACVSASTVFAQQERGRGGRGFGGGGIRGVVAMPEVQKELKLGDKEIADIKAALEDSRPDGGGGPRDLSAEEREKLLKQREEMDQKLAAKIKEIVSSTQWKRLSELRLQREGAASLNRPEVSQELKLTDDQKAKVKKISDEFRSQFMRPREGGGGQGAGRAGFEETRKKYNSDLLAVLTPEQKTQWDAMQGAKFEFPESPMGRGRAGGRAQRPASE